MVITDWSGGRNGVDSPVDPKFPMNQCVEAINVDFSRGPLGRRRGGATSLSLTGGTANTTGIRKLMHHMPTALESGQELWSIDAAGTPLWKRLAAGTAWADVTVSDAVSVTDLSTVPLIQGVSFNGKFFVFYPSAQDRMHVWDGSSVRRMGLQTPSAAPTVANTGAGAYPAVLRYYKVRWLHLSGSTIIRRSEASASVSFTPSGAGTAARITRPTAPNEGETHWEIEASSDNVNFYQLISAELGTAVAIGTTTYDDSAVAVYNGGNYSIAPITGLYTVVPSCGFGVTDGNRLVMGGNATLTARVWFTAVLGSLNKGDDERYINQTNLKGYLDLNEKNGGGLKAMAGPINGLILAFKYKQVWKLVPTGDPDTPYIGRRITAACGAINASSVCLAEDAAGNPAIYFISHKGIYRWSIAAGLEYMGRDIEDQWKGRNGKLAVNLNATLVSHCMYYPELDQVWFYVSTGSSNSPDTKLVLEIKNATRKDKYGVRGGWSIHDGDTAACTSACMFSNTPGATMSNDQKPYIGRTSNVTILKCDTTDPSDNGTTFQARVKSRSIIPSEHFGKMVTIQEMSVLADALSGVGLRATIDRDFGLDTASTSDILLTPEASETKVLRKFGDAQQSDMGVVQVQLGDSAAVSASQWSIDQLEIRTDLDGPI